MDLDMSIEVKNEPPNYEEFDDDIASKLIPTCQLTVTNEDIALPSRLCNESIEKSEDGTVDSVASESELIELGDTSEMDEEEEDNFDNHITTPPPRIIHSPRAKNAPNKVTPGTVKARRKRNSIPFPFSPDQEKDLARWLRDNPRYYNKRCREYRIIDVKRRMMEEKAKEFKDPEGNECKPAQLANWWANMRTYYGKLTKVPNSGSGGQKFTDREMWIRQTFTFLNGHIVRINGRQSVTLTSHMGRQVSKSDEEDDSSNQARRNQLQQTGQSTSGDADIPSQSGDESSSTSISASKEDDGDDLNVAAPPSRVIHTSRTRCKPLKKRRPNSIPFPFTPEQERDLAEWLRDNPRYYNKRCWEYRITPIKHRMMEEKAKEFKDAYGNECTFAQLFNWWSNMRSYYGKLSKLPKSDLSAGGHKLTDRESWIRQTFTFLNGHIIRIKGRRGVTLRSQDSGLHGQGNDVLKHSSCQEYQTLQDLHTNAAPDTEPSTAVLTAVNGGKSWIGSGTKKAEALKKEESDTSTMDKGPSPATPDSPRSAELDNFARDIVNSMRGVPEERWNDVKADIMVAIQNYSESAMFPST